MAKSNYLRDRVTKHVLNEAIFTPAATLYLALYTTNPGVTDSGTEVSGSGYARQAITWAAIVGHQKKNGAQINFPVVITSSITFRYWGIRDASSGGNLYYFGDNSTAGNLTANVGQQIQVPVGNLSIEES